MKTTKRFDRAIKLLYTAFHEGTLDAMSCCHCAVGNLCGNPWWADEAMYGTVHRINMDFVHEHVGYSALELANIEQSFLYGSLVSPKFQNTISQFQVEEFEYSKEEQRELQFKGLCAVVEYLCELDGIPNVMDYTKFFEREGEKAKYELV